MSEFYPVSFIGSEDNFLQKLFIAHFNENNVSYDDYRHDVVQNFFLKYLDSCKDFPNYSAYNSFYDPYQTEFSYKDSFLSSLVDNYSIYQQQISTNENTNCEDYDRTDICVLNDVVISVTSTYSTRDSGGHGWSVSKFLKGVIIDNDDAIKFILDDVTSDNNLYWFSVDSILTDNSTTNICAKTQLTKDIIIKLMTKIKTLIDMNVISTKFDHQQCSYTPSDIIKVFSS